jgi:hypothetical protein
LAKDAPTCLDIFVEAEYKAIPQELNLPKLANFHSPLATVRSQFESCLLKNKSDCPMSLRYHYVDVRQSYIQEKYQGTLVHLVIQSYNTDRSHEFLTKWKDISMIRDFYIGFNRSVEAENLTKLYFEDLLQDSVQKKLTEEQWMIIKEEIETTGYLVRRQLHKSILNKEKIKEIINQWPTPSTIEFMSLGMDIFTLGRLFSNFDKTKLSRGPQGCRSISFQKIKNAIIYCGDLHQQFLTFFIKKYFDLEPSIHQRCHNGIESENNQCIHFDPPFDFFTTNG